MPATESTAAVIAHVQVHAGCAMQQLLLLHACIDVLGPIAV
jgi:hypothetical protein